MITQAAILQIKTGKIFVGKRHGDIIRDIVVKHGIKPPIDPDKGFIQGFVNGEGWFMGRSAAANEAYGCGQIKKPKPELFSEDIY